MSTPNSRNEAIDVLSSQSEVGRLPHSEGKPCASPRLERRAWRSPRFFALSFPETLGAGGSGAEDNTTHPS